MNLGIMERIGIEPESVTTTLGKRAFSVAEASQETSLSKAYIRNIIAAGDLKVSRFGRRVVILAEDLESLLRNGRE